MIHDQSNENKIQFKETNPARSNFITARNSHRQIICFYNAVKKGQNYLSSPKNYSGIHLNQQGQVDRSQNILILRTTFVIAQD